TLSNDGVSLTDVFVAQGKVLMGVAPWGWGQQEQAGRGRTHIVAEHKRLQLQLGQAEAAARLQVIQTEMEARSAEIAVLADATGSASTLATTDSAVLRPVRHAHDVGRVIKPMNGDTSEKTNGDQDEP